ITKTICQLGFRCGQQSSQPATMASGFDRKATRNPQLHIVPSVTVIANGNASIICKENCIFLSHKTDYVKKMDVFIHY
ncbi:MAG: hypothetical protein PHE08_11775, partial [Bacteroidales bacterium]|nr:hypothetical protein [Bacteroidales bacterium]